MSTSKLATVAKGALILAVTWAVSIVGAEASFRLIGDRPSDAMKGLYVSFAKDNFKMGPLVSTEASLYAGHIKVYTDSLGLRCDEARRYGVKAGDSLDVILVGDSQGFGNGVNYEQSIAGTVIEKLAERGYRSANASVGGHHLGSQFELVRWLVEQQHVRISNYVFLLTPALIRSDDEYNHAVVGEDGRLYGKGRDNSTVGGRARLWAKTRLVTYGRVRDAARNLGLEPDDDSAVTFQLYGAEKQPSDELFSEQVLQFQSFAEKHGATVQFIYMPLTIEADFTPVREAARKAGRQVDADATWRVVSAVAKDLNIPIYDLRPTLKQAHAEGQVLKVKADFHYSPTLSQEGGVAIAENLRLTPKESAVQRLSNARK